MKTNRNKILAGIFIPLLSAMLVTISGCSQFLEIPPPKTELVTSSVFENNSTANAAILGIYSRMVNQSLIPYRISFLTGLSSDELTNYSTVQELEMFYTNNLNSFNVYVSSFVWTPAYNYIFQANEIIEGLRNTTGVNENVKSQILGEARFIRAYCHFYLVNFFGEIPLVTSTDYAHNATISRSSKEAVYQQIIEDLSEARLLLNNGYVGANGVGISAERVRPNKAAADALLARVYLYLGDYINAEAKATEVINNPQYNLVSDLDAVFLRNSPEAIWQLQPGFVNSNTPEGSGFILTSAPLTTLSRNATVSENLLASFEHGDKRRAHWISNITVHDREYFFPFKYKVDTPSPALEYSMVLRLAEQLLIRAEARAYQNNNGGALSDLNAIRERAGIPLIQTIDNEAILQAIIQERRVELFTEWGHRWLDIKRIGMVDAVMADITPLKGGVWSTNSQLYPIPQLERDNNPNLSQNTGY